jgi:DNA repair protein RecN (Recombination protein N)
MLVKLTINNYALIDNSEIYFKKGFTIITGETGAGKSILLGAMGLLMGQRADTSVMFNKENKCIVEAEFDVTPYSLQDFFISQNLDYQPLTIIRREIAVNGNSRAFINDTPVTLPVLKELSAFLIDVHSQHQTLNLNSGDFQLSVIDAVCNHQQLLNQYKADFLSYKNLLKELEILTTKQLNSSKELDFIQFQFNELEEAQLHKINQPQLEDELEILSNAEEIKSNLIQAEQLISENEYNVLQLLNTAKQLVGKHTNKNQTIQALYNRLNNIIIELKDFNNEINRLQSSIQYNPLRVEELTQLLDKVYRLQKKHGVTTTDELIGVMNLLSEQLAQTENLENQINEIKNRLAEVKQSLSILAKQLHQNRLQAIKLIENQTHDLLSKVGMKNAQLKIELSETTDFTPFGTDKVFFKFSANKGIELNEISKVASGGELSRLMLCLKSIIAEHKKLPTILFDEIDTGVSGEIADKIARILQQMGKQMQVIAITHLPQMAGKGDHHFYVFKQEINNRTYSKIKELNSDERVEEIAKMLSAGKITQASIDNAKEMLNLI